MKEKNKKLIMQRAKDATNLDGRIKANKAQTTNLNEWVFKNIEVYKGEKILELCCGTGSQTEYLTKIAGPKGRIYALDISSQALNQLSNKLSPNYGEWVTTVKSDIDKFQDNLTKIGIKAPHFDLIFCSYGLYYSESIQKTLNKIASWIKPDGRFVVIGPFGPNNGPLYNHLGKSKVIIDDYIMHTSSYFMTKELLPWITEKFKTVNIKTLVNPVIWETSEMFLSYWKNTTFFDKTKLKLVEKSIIEFFKSNKKFVNEKWVMMIEAKHIRDNKKTGRKR